MMPSTGCAKSSLLTKLALLKFVRKPEPVDFSTSSFRRHSSMGSPATLALSQAHEDVSPTLKPSNNCDLSSLAVYSTSLTPASSFELAQRSFAASATPPPRATSVVITSGAVGTGRSGAISNHSSVSEHVTARSEDEGSERVMQAQNDTTVLLDDALSATTGSKKKGRNFIAAEDLNLAASWLDVSQDPVVGDEQKRDAFWSKVHEEFVGRSGATPSHEQRGVHSLHTRWRNLQAACNKFAGCYAAIVARNESGKTVEDKILDAHVLYREQNNGPSRAKRDTNAAVTQDDAERHRPGGRKAAKKASETETGLIALVAKLAKETEEKIRLLKEATSEQIMARSLDGMTTTQRRYYQLKQEQILTELEKEIRQQ
ncbi:putative Myb DNA binding domain-containing protein [Phytophthora infestans]|uniref:Putative Myb DNA binding domain-containing protein n=1 Tax=Phytophthora infestans TaxID=4787 RepID=A0A833THQ3_PHYIN|nr:putative Myb DNA binding domain-containing protein [Phytophthora infestans]